MGRNSYRDFHNLLLAIEIASEHSWLPSVPLAASAYFFPSSFLLLCHVSADSRNTFFPQLSLILG
jgi:hypothetical protein